MIPVKDAGLIARCEDPALRREWRSRLVDHDGQSEHDGGIARWLILTDALGLERNTVVSLAGLLPATRFGDAYVHFVRERLLLEAVASLTELFSPQVTASAQACCGAMISSADLLPTSASAPLARRGQFALDYVKRHAQPPQAQQCVLAALELKCDVCGPCSRPTMPM
jgi:coenzyme PQQ biosynthesis protein C